MTAPPFTLQETVTVLEYTHYQKSLPNIEAKLSCRRCIDAAQLINVPILKNINGEQVPIQPSKSHHEPVNNFW